MIIMQINNDDIEIQHFYLHKHILLCIIFHLILLYLFHQESSAVIAYLNFSILTHLEAKQLNNERSKFFLKTLLSVRTLENNLFDST